MRLSSYLILSERLQRGSYALQNGMTGAVELISEPLHDALLQLMQSSDPQQTVIDEQIFSTELIETYLERGHFTELSHAQERELLEKIASALHQVARSRPSVVIVPELDCNYRCVYCFERTLQKGLKTQRTNMDKTEVDAVFAAIDQLAAGSDGIGQVVLYGGEPLQQKNLKLIEQIVSAGEARGISFMAVSNGHDLNAFLHLFSVDKISALQITIDGLQEVHDRRRVALDGSSSFQRIIENIRLAIEATDVKIVTRINLDDQNYPGFVDLLKVFEREGWLNHSQISINAAIVHVYDSCGAASPLQDVSQIRAELDEVLSSYNNILLGSAEAITGSSVLSALVYDRPSSLRSSFCAACSGMYIFLPNGQVSCCWEAIGDQRSLIGSYSAEGLELDEQRAELWFGRSAAMIDECADCRYSLLCAGGCPQQAGATDEALYQANCCDFAKSYGWVLADAVEGFLKVGGL
ncbi:MAG: SPASM domain-containing protein [Coriobacteriia bacterium]|nr:SPASM domain-containing protein [Coriobacteriia bacterium]